MQEALIKTIAMPSDIDKEGKISAGWVSKQLDLAAGVAVKELTGQRSVTIAMNNIHFKEPILVGDYVLCFARITKLGKSSIKIQLHIDLKRLDTQGFSLKKEVISAEATFVSLDKNGKKIDLSLLDKEKQGCF
ncbi:acyl-CoA thioesterase [Campylobacter sp. MIT 12-8780]|uniref:acyl-CoA thioesterase n=1 Tax=unclassified Campylobacter TaxID=2593542 RepID=UPI0010F528A2|nr:MULTISPECIES: hotdog domain-containing protein [unclassified Campylobacter]NDJ26612.1 acyl-CoA thioesterase [Campylobacter sp. MIT 19-121]TKX29204.1 acyl-CoA thioesterase [Campylobacter sp. MIT 12-5580]TQR43173.1 acyl-CoA thioesterase [Campylobacter sp. MIT 12-8780]